MGKDRDRNDHGRFDDRIDPDTVLEVFDAREDHSRPLTAGDVVDELGIARRTAHNKLNALVERGVLETRKVGARGRVWWVPSTADEHGPRDGREAAENAPGVQQGPSDADAHNADENAETPARAVAGPDAADSYPTDSDHTPETPERGVTLEDVDFPSGRDRDECERAVVAARDYIREHGGATKQDLVKGVMPDHSLGYDVDAALAKLEAGERFRGAWWRRVIKPGLKALSDVQTPPQGASEWRYIGDG
jgi:hypothetical protein